MKIEVRNLNKEFKRNLVLDNVNMTLESGKIYGFVGRNGSGKSVLLKIMCGFYNPTSGSICYDGKDIFKDNSFAPDTRALIEKPGFIADLSGYDNLEMLAIIQDKIGSKEINKALEDVNLTSEKDKKFGKYSLGMKQKLGIAQVLMENPSVMIFDEPFNGVEEETVKKLRNILKEKKKEGKLIIISSHIKEDIDKLADIIYKFDNGKVEKMKEIKDK